MFPPHLPALPRSKLFSWVTDRSLQHFIHTYIDSLESLQLFFLFSLKESSLKQYLVS
jgi:hypothetical protein